MIAPRDTGRGIRVANGMVWRKGRKDMAGIVPNAVPSPLDLARAVDSNSFLLLFLLQSTVCPWSASMQASMT